MEAGVNSCLTNKDLNEIARQTDCKYVIHAIIFYAELYNMHYINLQLNNWLSFFVLVSVESKSITVHTDLGKLS